MGKSAETEGPESSTTIADLGDTPHSFSKLDRHSVALQELIVQLGTERDELLGQMVNEGRVESA